MPQRIALRLETAAWQRRLPAAAAIARRAARAALAGGRTGRTRNEGDLCLVLADDALQRRLNHDFCGADKSTNVLSFDGAPASLGDVVLALETIAAEAESQGKSLADHLAHLVVHGVLHLMGYDHHTGAEARAMERLERELLAGLGIADPYRVVPVAPRKRMRA